MKMKPADALWLLAYPIYQFIGTARHELSHALAALLQGARITEVRLLPSFHSNGGYLMWGYVSWTGGHTNWVVMAAPYICDLLVFPIFVWLCTRLRDMPRWLWLNCFIIGIVSPLIDTASNYQKVFRIKHGDVYGLMSALPPLVVHSVFLAALALFCAGAWATIRVSGMERKSKAGTTTP